MVEASFCFAIGDRRCKFKEKKRVGINVFPNLLSSKCRFASFMVVSVLSRMPLCVRSVRGRVGYAWIKAGGVALLACRA